MYACTGESTHVLLRECMIMQTDMSHLIHQACWYAGSMRISYSAVLFIDCCPSNSVLSV